MTSEQAVCLYRALIYWGEDQHEEFASGTPQEIADKARAAYGDVTRNGEPLARTVGNACLSLGEGRAYAEVQLPGEDHPTLEISCPRVKGVSP